ncbi:MAG: molybdenum cofactor guanylyltransferase [Candidatus Bathyarchaeia archaeon]
MDRTAIILAGGHSQRFGSDKGLIKLADKPLILHVIDRIRSIVDDVVVCVKSDAQSSLYSQILPNGSRIVIDVEGFPQCPLTGALTGLMSANGEYSAILPCDTPFISKNVLDFLFDVAIGVNAVIPRWPNDYIEPLHAVYRTKPALEAARKALEVGSCRMQFMISKLRGVRYISTIVIGEIDPKMVTFLNINTPLDLRKAKALLKRGLVP